MCLQWWVRKPIAKAYLNNQRQTNRLTAHTYNAWDNIFSGNRYNFRLWHAGFKLRLRNALDAQIRVHHGARRLVYRQRHHCAGRGFWLYRDHRRA